MEQKFLLIFGIFECILFVNFSNETQENDDETNISQEILVLDFGDEKSEFLRSGGESDFNGGKFIYQIIFVAEKVLFHKK